MSKASRPRRRFAHIINPFLPPSGSPFAWAQPITFESLRRAQAYASGLVDVELYTAQYAADRPVVPPHMTCTEDLQRSIRDEPALPDSKKLPYIADILDRLYTTTSADFLIYTNVDIAVMEPFYVALDCLVAQGYDAFDITRRTIPNHYRTPDQLPMMYAEVGTPHVGWDCFVFHRSLYPKLVLDDLFIGAPGFDTVLVESLRVHARHYEHFTNLHLTFHLGDDRSWRGSPPALINCQRSVAVLRELLPVCADPETAQHLRRRIAWLRGDPPPLSLRAKRYVVRKIRERLSL